MSDHDGTAVAGKARTPTTEDAIREIRIWADHCTRWFDNAIDDARNLDAAGQDHMAEAMRQAALDWQFRAASLSRGADALEAIKPVEDKVRDLVRSFRAKSATRTAKRTAPAAEGASA